MKIRGSQQPLKITVRKNCSQTCSL